MSSDRIMDEISRPLLKTLLINPDKSFTKKDLAEEAEVSRDALYRRWEGLEKLGIVKEDEHKYTLNKESELSQALADIIVQLEHL